MGRFGKFHIVTIFLALLTSYGAFAQSQNATVIGVGPTQYGGTGCPAGTLSTSFAPDNMSFSLIYDSFVASVTADQRRRTSILYCDAAIPIQVPKGMQVSITHIDYRGFALVPDHGRADFLAAYSFDPNARHSWRPEVVTQSFQAPMASDYIVSSDGSRASTRTSACGGPTLLRLRNVLETHAPKGSESQITLDSLDGTLHSQYFLTLHKCH